MNGIDNRLVWYSSAGVRQPHGVALAAGTYYAEIPKGRADGFSASIAWGATEQSVFTLESANDADLETYDAAGTGWTSQAVAPHDLGTITAAASQSCDGWDIYEAQAKRWRVKRVVTVGDADTEGLYFVAGN